MADDPIDDSPAALAALVHELRAEVAELRSRLDATAAATPRLPVRPAEAMRRAREARGAQVGVAPTRQHPTADPSVATDPSAATEPPVDPSVVTGPSAVADATGTTPEGVPASHRRAVGRRRALVGMAGAAAAGTVAALAPASPSAAADGDALVLGADNVAPTRTRLTGGGAFLSDGPSGDDGEGVLSVRATDPLAAAVRARSVGGAAISAVSDGGWGIRAHGEDAGAVLSSDRQFGVIVDSGEYGIAVAGEVAHLAMVPNAGEPIGAERTDYAGTVYMQGSGIPMVDGALWLCVAEGEPGTWRKLAGHDTAGSLHLLPAPARVYDSRPGHHPTAVDKGALPGGTATRTIDLKANDSGVPAGATGALITVLVVNAPRGNGNLTLWAAGQPQPQANTMVWGGDAGRFTTLAMSAVDDQARVQVATSTRTHLVLDVVGYYR